MRVARICVWTFLNRENFQKPDSNNDLAVNLLPFFRCIISLFVFKQSRKGGRMWFKVRGRETKDEKSRKCEARSDRGTFKFIVWSNLHTHSPSPLFSSSPYPLFPCFPSFSLPSLFISTVSFESWVPNPVKVAILSKWMLALLLLLLI